MAKQGNIGVTSENIFPIIKKFLYSDHEIFLRELVSNAVDATQKLKTLASVGEFKGELGDLTVHVSFDSNTIKISDRGIGMTAEEIDKSIRSPSPAQKSSLKNTRTTQPPSSATSDLVSILLSWFPRKWRSSPNRIKKEPFL